jgi:hypothetical protein
MILVILGTNSHIFSLELLDAEILFLMHRRA